MGTLHLTETATVQVGNYAACIPTANPQTQQTAMAENAPPSSAKDTTADASRGMPYYERLRRDLRESLAKKRHIDANLVSLHKKGLPKPLYLLQLQAQLEENILRSETLYLEETGAGNIIKGFDNYIKGAATITTTGGAGSATRRKAPVSEIDRIFSRSSGFLRVRL
jgi:chromatin modification-related protein EAF6